MHCRMLDSHAVCIVPQTYRLAYSESGIDLDVYIKNPITLSTKWKQNLHEVNPVINTAKQN